MRDYGKIGPRFWTGPTGKAIREAGRDAQVVALYLLTCPSSNMIGLYYLPLPTLCHEIGITQQGASKALQRLSEAGFAYYEAPSEYVFVPEMAKYQVGESLKPADLRVKGVIKEWESHRNSIFFLQFYERYRDAFHLPEPSPFEAPSKPRTGTGTGTGTGTRTRTGSEERVSALAFGPGWVTFWQNYWTESGFAEFWQAYPRKVDKDSAAKVWRKLNPDAQLRAAILAAVVQHRASEQWQRDDGQFIPHPTTWLNKRRWEAEIHNGGRPGNQPGGGKPETDRKAAAVDSVAAKRAADAEKWERERLRVQGGRG